MSTGYLWNMTTKAPRISKRKGPTKEGAAMDKAFKQATAKAREEAFKVRKTILTERDGWLVLIKKDGTIWRRVKQVRGARERAA